ncbi:MAG: alpha/beta hydrolase fold domain-containing protein [Ilumatobacteraceae bacterium]
MSTGDRATPILPGRLGNPDMALADDPRADPRMIAALATVGLGGPAEPSPVTGASPLDELHTYVDEAEQGFGGLFDVLMEGLEPVAGVERSVEIVSGVDGNDITLYVHRPAHTDGPVPAVLHIHGGGMVLLEAAGLSYQRWRDELAATGMVVVGVEFRNGGGKHGRHPFPAGLNDCTTALQWLHDHRGDFGISKIVVSGESGGGNLTLATTLKAKRDGRLGQIDGVYAQCPYISGAYADPPATLPSLTENDGYFIACDQMGALAKVYDPDGENATNPLAWPLNAGTDDLAGLPPHVVSVNQLDPLRDEGLAYYRKLVDAGVSAYSRTVNGTCHAGDCIYRTAMPEVYSATIRDIKGFADSL